MFTRPSIAIACALLGACAGTTEELPQSDTARPNVTFPGIQPPEVFEEWPCPPFEGFETTQEEVGDDDGDNVTDCQESVLGSDPNNPDTDGDTVGDFFERGDIRASWDDDGDGQIDEGRGLDTDDDGVLDILDDDDDGDGIPTAEEDSKVDDFGNGNGDPLDDDFDGDGIRNYVDDDDDNDLVTGFAEDFHGGDGDGDPRNDDFDGDGIPNYIDDDDDNDSASGCEDSDRDRVVDGAKNESDGTFRDDLDQDGLLDFVDVDDDGDGILTEDEDANGDGNPCNDDLDGDRSPDFLDLDEDGDDLPTTAEDRNRDGDVRNDDSDSDGTPDYRDSDDDEDGVPTEDENPGDGAASAQDTDRDLTPDFLETDDDNDGVLTVNEFMADGDGNPADTDGDGTPDYIDADDDGDGCRTDDEPNSALDANTVPGTCSLATDLQVVGKDAGFDIFDEDRVWVALYDGDNDLVGVSSGIADDIAVDGEAVFTVTFPLLVLDGETYSVDVFADEDGDGLCLKEQAWRVGGIAVTVDGPKEGPIEVDVRFASDANAAACGTFP